MSVIIAGCSLQEIKDAEKLEVATLFKVDTANTIMILHNKDGWIDAYLMGEDGDKE